MENNRIGWIDIAKGIGILLVMFGHLAPTEWTYVVYGFHIPLFFWLSGVTFDRKKYPDLKIVVKKKFISLLVPYLAISAVTYLMWAARDWPARWSINIGPSILYGNSNLGVQGYDPALWFLPCLFAAEIGYWLVSAKLKNTALKAAVVGSAVIGWWLGYKFPGLYLPLGGEVAFTGLAFFGLGNLMKSVNLKSVWAAALTVIYLIADRSNYLFLGTKVDMRVNHLGNAVWFYLAAVTGIMICGWLAKKINKSRILERIGRKSLVLFAWHQALFMYLDIYLRPLIPPSNFQYGIIIAIYIPLVTGVILLGDRIYNTVREQA